MEKLFFILPNFIQNIMISIYNSILYKTRNGGNYKKYKKMVFKNNNLLLDELKTIQSNNFKDFILFAKANSTFYKVLYKNTDLTKIEISDISKLPILNKDRLRKDINKINTISKKEGIISKTGGTTGKSLEVIFTKDDMQMRYAFLDNFRNGYNYKLGEKTAWFSGKKLLNPKDLNKNRFWKTDYINKVRYYSTFHINDNYLKYYIADLKKYKPKYIVGFPSSLLEIAKYGIRNNIIFPKGVIKALFPTAETITEEIREMLSNYFQTRVVDQYASSEGAPFIFECKNANLHLELQSGVFEVLDDFNQPTNEGRLVLTSFSTHGTPLIRYDIGDRIKLATNKTCNCGNNNPLVDKIMGRIDDYIYSPKNGKINLGNISNTLKSVHGILKFQVIQNEINTIDIKIVIDDEIFNKKYKKIFIENWRDRVGNKMIINIDSIDSIPTEKSGKYRMIKNNIKNLL